MTESSEIRGRADEALLDLAVEGWRLARLFTRVLGKLDAGEGSRYANQVRYFLKRVEESLGAADMRLVNLEGQPYDTGLPATAINIEDFAPDDRLYVEQMLEPVIMGPQGIVKTGTVTLQRVG
jgi:hypothetical protein